MDYHSNAYPRHARPYVMSARLVHRAISLLTAFLCALTFGGGALAEPLTEKVTITFVAAMEERDGHTRLTGVKPSDESLKLIELHPGDVIVFEVKRVDVVVEKWTQEFEWEVERSEGKDTIKEQTKQSRNTSIRLKWGVSIAPKFSLGNAEVDLSKDGKQEIQTQHAFLGATSKIGFSGVNVQSQPAIRRPPTAPANATAKPVQLVTSDSSGRVIANNSVVPNCELTIEIIRASVTK